jgi:hypothetical protein
MYAVVRRYTGAQALVNAMEQKKADVEKLLKGVPGFRSYYAINSGGSVATITVCDDKAGTDESSRRAADWVRQNVPIGAINAPEVTEGETYIQFNK